MTTAPLIHAKMAKILADIEPVKKEGKAAPIAGGYAYRKADDVMNALHVALAKHEIYLTSRVVDTKILEPIKTRSGSMHHFLIHYEFCFRATDGSFVTTEALGEGADSGDKTAGKCFTYAYKDAICKALSIPTEDMVDADDHHIEPVYESEPDVVAPPPETPETRKRRYLSDIRGKLEAMHLDTVFADDVLRVMIEDRNGFEPAIVKLGLLTKGGSNYESTISN